MSISLVAAIVPAFNEEETIGPVVAALKASPLLSEVIVVSDGSTDQTAQVARRYGATVYDLQRNGGKGNAMLHGVAHTDAPILLFIDADLRGLNATHIEQLIEPLIHGARVMNVGLRDRGRFFFPLYRFLPLVSGERAIKRNIVEAIPSRFMQGFMVESALNYYCRSRRLPYGSVPLKGLTIRRKYEKVGWGRALKQYTDAIAEGLKAAVVLRVAHLIGKF